METGGCHDDQSLSLLDGARPRLGRGWKSLTQVLLRLYTLVFVFVLFYLISLSFLEEYIYTCTFALLYCKYSGECLVDKGTE